MEPFVFPLITAASLMTIVVANRRFRRVPVGKGSASAAFGLVAFAGASAVVGWAGEDSARMMALLAVMVGVALFLVFQVVRKRVPRGRGEGSQRA